MNPLQMLLNSGNPMMMINQLAGSNPVMKRALEMGQGKSPEEIKMIVRNIAQQKGMSEEQLNMYLSQFGMKL